MKRGTLVKFKSQLTDRWFKGKVLRVLENKAIVEDLEKRWGPDVISMHRIEIL